MMDEKPTATMQVLDAADPADVEFVHNGLRRYNEQFADPAYRDLYVFLRDDDGGLIGGVLAEVYWGWLTVNVLWVDERYRGLRYGERMLVAAEEEARRRGCGHARLDTLSFQALPFYEKLGYRVYGELADYPAGRNYTRYFLAKSL
jgi:GNAT superfamily N-acetyltransferase